LSGACGVAITRTPGDNAGAGLTHSDLGPVDLACLREQHAAYVAALTAAGAQVTVLDPLPAHPDGYFVEDVAVVVPELAVITRPGAASRRGEAVHIEAALARHRELARLEAPATLEGGDVMVIGKRVYIGLSARTNRHGAAQLAGLLAPFGYRCTVVPVRVDLHLKSGIGTIGGGDVLIAPAYADCEELDDCRLIPVSATEAHACNSVRINDTVLIPRGAGRLRETLLERGIDVTELDLSEVRKMDGGLSCMSLRLQ